MFYKVSSLFISPFRDPWAGFAQGLLIMDTYVAVLRCVTMSLVDRCFAVLYYTLFCPAVPCQYGLANGLWLTGDCVG